MEERHEAYVTSMMWKQVIVTVCLLIMASCAMDATAKHHKIRLPTPNCSETTTYCESDRSYPKAQIRRILRTSKVDLQLFNTGPASKVDEMETRYGDNETMLCPTMRKTIFPKMALNVNREWRFIINLENFKQAMRVDLCRDPSAPCTLFQTPVSGVATQCKQTFIERRLLAVNTFGHTVIEEFSLPSGCACAYRNSFFHKFNTGNSKRPINGS